jgi:hypothetical protein
VGAPETSRPGVWKAAIVSAFNSPGFSIAEPSRTRSVGVERNAPAPARQEYSGRDAFLTPGGMPKTDLGEWVGVTPSQRSPTID